MTFLKCSHVLILATILTVRSAQGQTSCPAPGRQLYHTPDRTESMITNNNEEEGYVLPPEGDTWCKDPVNLRFRRPDGTCNNVNNLGSTSKPLDQLVPPNYDDGYDTARERGVNGQPLPSARNVSMRLHPAVDVFANFTIMTMQFGQWLAHDCVATAAPSGRVNCCGANGGCPPFVSDKNCLPIEVPVGDDTFNGTCLNFVRSLAANDSYSLPLRPRKQINANTGFIDGSQIYGSNDETAAAVREPGGFLLRTTNNGTLLPESPTATCTKQSDEYCFLAGDSRVNQHPYLAAFSTIWAREHNRIARRLRQLNSVIPNEEVFQRAKKIVGAMQHVIAYNHYLPIIIGDDAVNWGLTSNFGRSIYNPSLNPSIFTAFSTAAFRFGHSTVPSIMPVGNSSLRLRDLFNNVGVVFKRFDDVILGMTGNTNVSPKSVQTADRNFVPDISKKLFMNAATGVGLDLVSINIQRGRDHGLAPYVKWRAFCGLRALTGFNDTDALGPFVSELGKVYSSIEDIDLYTGFLYERIDKGLLGPTARCLIRIQFHRLKYGDRFFFDNNEPSSAFTDAQLSALRSITLAKIFCLNTKIQRIQKDVFKFPSETNPLINCASQTSFDLSLFV